MRLPTTFLIGAYAQPEPLMDTWASRGVNTLVLTPDGSDIINWSIAAAAKGFGIIRQPSENLSFDLSQDELLAWAQPDEPSNTKSQVEYGQVAIDPQGLDAFSSPLRAAAQEADREMPMWVNHVGNHITGAWSSASNLMRDYMAGQESDWLSSDSYQVQSSGQMTLDVDGYVSTNQGVALDRMASWSGGKPTFTFIGLSEIEQGSAAPTSAQIEAQIWSSVIHGASGIIYFSIDFTDGFSWDSTSPEIVDAITPLNGLLSANSELLMSSLQETGGRTVYRSAELGVVPGAGEMPHPFEAVQLCADGKTYFVVLNLSDEPQVFMSDIFGLGGTVFEPYQCISDLPGSSWRSEASDNVPSETTTSSSVAGDGLKDTDGLSDVSGASIRDAEDEVIRTETSDHDANSDLTFHTTNDEAGLVISRDEEVEGGGHKTVWYTDGKVSAVKTYFADWTQEASMIFDVVGQITSDTRYLSNGIIRTTTYDAAHGTSPATISEADANWSLISTSSYDESGRVLRREDQSADGSHTVTWYTEGQVIALKTYLPDWTPHASYVYENGLITGETQYLPGGGIETRTYDAAHGLAPATISRFDAASDLLSIGTYDLLGTLVQRENSISDGGHIITYFNAAEQEVFVKHFAHDWALL